MHRLERLCKRTFRSFSITNKGSWSRTYTQYASSRVPLLESFFQIRAQVKPRMPYWGHKVLHTWGSDLRFWLGLHTHTAFLPSATTSASSVITAPKGRLSSRSSSRASSIAQSMNFLSSDINLQIKINDGEIDLGIDRDPNPAQESFLFMVLRPHHHH